MCLVTRAGPCDAENPATQEDDHAALCWKALRTTATRHPASTYRKAKPARQILEMPSRYRFYSTRPADFLRKANIPGVTRRAFAPAARQGGRSRCATARLRAAQSFVIMPGYRLHAPSE